MAYWGILWILQYRTIIPLDSDENYKHHIDSRRIATLGLELLTLIKPKIESWSYVAEGVFSLSNAASNRKY